MCVRPILISNPTFGRVTYASEFGRAVEIPKQLVPSEAYIKVSCGKCPECRGIYYNSILQRALVESLTSYMFFVTLTYDNKHIPSIKLPNGKTLFYTNYNDVQNLFKRLRNHNILDRDFRYLVALEYGDNNCRPHIHLLIFVAKKKDDDIITPYNIERLLFDNLKKFFSINTGTRKNPHYECLFTYRTRVTLNGLKTNYFVKYIEPTVYTDATFDMSNDNDTYIKTIRYLIGYVNKGSSFDDTVLTYLNDIPDELLRNKLSYLLRSKFRFSKGFGCGFTPAGEKDYLHKISVRSSVNSMYYTELVDTLPKNFSDFVDLYPNLYQDLQEFIISNPYKGYSTLEECLLSLSHTSFICHCLFLKYFPLAFSRIYKNLYKKSALDSPKISYFFDKQHYSYHRPLIRTTDTSNSVSYDFLRKGVDQGLISGVPFLAFRTNSQGGYTALCRYYKERVCTIADLQQLFTILNVSNYEDYATLFDRQKTNKKALISQSNKNLHSQSEKIILKTQKNCLVLSRQLEGVDIYRVLLTD